MFLNVRSQNTSAHLALLIVALIYAGNYLIAKVVMDGDYIKPLGFVLLRVISGTTLFWLVSLFTVRERIHRSDWKFFVLCGLTGVAANQSLFFSGLDLTTPIHASLIMTVSPMLVLVFSYLILKEHITGRKVTGIFVGCAGAVTLMTLGKEVMTGSQYLVGDLMIFLNATSYALYLVLVKRLIRQYAPLTVIKWVFSAGLIFVFPLGIGQMLQIDWQTFQFTTWLAVAYVLLCVTFLAYLLNIFALKRVSPNTVSIYIYLQPLFASVLSVIFTGEEISLIKLVSGVLIFSGVYLVSSSGVSGAKPVSQGPKNRPNN